MTFAELQGLFKRITYKPGWKFLLFQEFDHCSSECSVRIQFTADDATSDKKDIHIMGQYQLCFFEHTEARDILKQLRGHIHHMECHEADEWLKLGGEAPFYPH